jgi:uncharacterized membrane protein YeaQ/YmgE (transglycosylase-associated protein family)
VDVPRTAARLRGVAGGAAILCGFGAVWVGLALLGWAARPPWAVSLAAFLFGFLETVAVVRFLSARRLPSPVDEAAAVEGRRMGMLFGMVFGLEGALIGLGSFLLGRLGHGVWIPSMAAAVVGLHFLPLARLFRVPAYYWTGAAMLACAVFTSVIAAPDVRILVLALVTGAILWATAGWVLWGTRLARVLPGGSPPRAS